MPESAPLPALPTPRGVRQASMISASVMGVVLLFLTVEDGFESRGQRSQSASRTPASRPLRKNAKTTPCKVGIGVPGAASPICRAIDTSGKTGATIDDRSIRLLKQTTGRLTMDVRRPGFIGRRRHGRDFDARRRRRNRAGL